MKLSQKKYLMIRDKFGFKPKSTNTICTINLSSWKGYKELTFEGHENMVAEFPTEKAWAILEEAK